jgi:hypothetical protein
MRLCRFEAGLETRHNAKIGKTLVVQAPQIRILRFFREKLVSKAIVKVLIALSLASFFDNGIAAIWTISPTVQDGNAEIGSPTLGMLSWSAYSAKGTSASLVYGSPVISVPDYACYGLAFDPNSFRGNCVASGKSIIWHRAAVVYTGGVINDADLTSASNFFAWTGQAGSEERTTSPLFVSSILSGTYFGDGTAIGTDPGPGSDGVGYDANGFSCWNFPASLHVRGDRADFCGNSTGVKMGRRAGSPQTIVNRFITNGITDLVDNGDGTITIAMTSTAYSDCLADKKCAPGKNSSDLTVVWRLNAIRRDPDAK